MIGFYSYTVILTYISLGLAMLGCFYSISGAIYTATLLLFLCGVCDMFDGKIARSKKNRTDDEKKFGIQIDSLCDLVAFSVLPSIIGYNLGIKSWGIIALCVYTLCGVIRLGYFNVVEDERQQKESVNRKYYQGLPVTVSAFLIPLVVLLSKFITMDLKVVYLVMLIVLATLQVLDIRVKKPQL